MSLFGTKKSHYLNIYYWEIRGVNLQIVVNHCYGRGIYILCSFQIYKLFSEANKFFLKKINGRIKQNKP